MAHPFALIALLALPAIVLLHMYRQRRPVRRVAGVFLWGMPTAAARRNGRPQSRLHAGPLGRDVTVAVLLTTIAVDIQFGGASRSGGAAIEFETVFRSLLCLAAAGLLAWSWRRGDSTGQNMKAEQP